MANDRIHYQELERTLTVFVILDLVLFLGYLLCGILDVLAGKIILFVIVLVVSGYGIWVLRNTREFGRSRSLWLTCSFICIPLCSMVSLICNYP